MNRYAEIFLTGTALTFGVAYLLYEHGHKLAAAMTVFWSPFPCPPGLPC